MLSLWLVGSPIGTLWVVPLSAALAGFTVVRWVTFLGGDSRAQHAAGLMLAFLPNSLGLSSKLLTDAVSGHLCIFWAWLLYLGFKERSGWFLVASLPVLWLLQLFKPTYNLAWLLIVGAAVLWLRTRSMLKWVAIALVCTLPVPLYLSARNFSDHGIFSASLLGVSSAREYLQARFAAEELGISYAQAQREIRDRDAQAIAERTWPSSPSGRRYLVKQQEFKRFVAEHPIATLRLMLTEMLQQFFAPQEFLFLSFVDEVPVSLRVLGSILTLLLWLSAALGLWRLWKTGDFQSGLWLLGFCGYFLGTASIVHHVGARLRLPIDLMAIPFAAWAFYVTRQAHNR